MKVTLVVEMCVEVPDGTEPDSLCLNLDVDLIEVEDVSMGVVEGARVTSYETKEVIVDNG